MSLLVANDVHVSFGGVKAVDGVSFEVGEGEIYSIMGPNGAGKTTVFNLISRFYDVDEGTLTFDDEDITNIRPHQAAAKGIARTFQNTELFERETVLQNLLIAHHLHRKSNLVTEMAFLPSVRRQELEFRKKVEDVIDLLNLQSYRYQPIGALPYGIRKIVEIARALSLEPKLLMLDEPSSGLNPEETEDLSFWIEDINKDLGITILMVEHDMGLLSIVSERVMCMADGQVLTVGSAEAVQNHPDVVAAYLGD